MTPPRKTGRNLLKNGTFEKNFLDPGNGWNAANPNEPGVAQEKDLGTGLNYLYFERGIVQQRFALPVNPSKLDATDYGYQFSFQYQPTRFPGGKEPYAELRAWPSEEKDRVELPTAGSDNRSATDDYTHWLSREVFLNSYAPGDTEFEVRLASGRNPEVNLSAPEHEPPEATPLTVEWPFKEGELHVAGSSTDASAHPGVAVQLHLPPLTLQDGKVRIHFEGDTHIAPLLPDGRVPICRGAVHTMTLLPQEDNGWAGDDVYPGTDVYASCEPAQEAERLKVTLSATAPKPDGEQHVTEPWRITCGNEASGSLDIVIESIYNAKPFKLPCAVGHYQLTIGEHTQSSHWPVISLEEQTELRVQVFNPVAEVPADNVTVTWSMPNGATFSSSTNNDGWAKSTFQPTQDNTIVKASVEAPYNTNPDQYTFTVRAIPTLPWGQFDITLDDEPITSDEPDLSQLQWGKTHTLHICPSAHCVLVGETVELTLRSAGASGVHFSPALDWCGALPDEGLTWQITCEENAAGVVELALTCERMPAHALEFSSSVEAFGISTLQIASRDEQAEGSDPFDLGYVRDNKLFYIRQAQSI